MGAIRFRLNMTKGFEDLFFISWPAMPMLLSSKWILKWSGRIGQRSKAYLARMNGYENDEATELLRQV